MHKREMRDVSGLGVHEKRARVARAVEKFRQERSQLRQGMQQTFQERQKQSQQLLKVNRNIHAAKKTIYELDLRYNVDCNDLWPEKYLSLVNNSAPRRKTDDTYSDNETETNATLEDEIDYRSYYKNKYRMDGAIVQRDDDYENSKESSAAAYLDGEIAVRQLYECLEYLRSTYFYCVYCGSAYDDEADLVANCPGIDEDSH